MWQEAIDLLTELAEEQRIRLLHQGRRLVPGLTEDDLWQPNDFSELEGDPLFRYEEGIWCGLLSALAALGAASRDVETHSSKV